MHRKKNLDTRLISCQEYLLDNKIDLNAKLAIQTPNYIDINGVYKNDNPLYLEIGCGKGGFAISHALKYSQVNFLAVERLSNVVVSGAEKASLLKIDNLRFLITNAELLMGFLKMGSVQKIFLNFSCPYPKKKQENRRLTNDKFLTMYSYLLADAGTIEQKTDNKDFFEYSMESFLSNGWQILFYTEDLYSLDDKDNIMTEYEYRFTSQGYPIFKLIAAPPK
jgi:tRNA (guanine-N7-)-methyltransferase